MGQACDWFSFAFGQMWRLQQGLCAILCHMLDRVKGNVLVEPVITVTVSKPRASQAAHYMTPQNPLNPLLGLEEKLPKSQREETLRCNPEKGSLLQGMARNVMFAAECADI